MTKHELVTELGFFVKGNITFGYHDFYGSFAHTKHIKHVLVNQRWRIGITYSHKSISIW